MRPNIRSEWTESNVVKLRKRVTKKEIGFPPLSAFNNHQKPTPLPHSIPLSSPSLSYTLSLEERESLRSWILGYHFSISSIVTHYLTPIIHIHFQFNFIVLLDCNFPRKTMSHAVFQSAQIMPINTQIPNNSLFMNPLTIVNCYPLTRKYRKSLIIRDSLSPPPSVDGDSAILHLERCLVASPTTSSSSSMASPIMKDKYGAFGAVTLEKSKLDMTQKQTRLSPEVYNFSILLLNLLVEYIEFFIFPLWIAFARYCLLILIYSTNDYCFNVLFIALNWVLNFELPYQECIMCVISIIR